MSHFSPVKYCGWTLLPLQDRCSTSLFATDVCFDKCTVYCFSGCEITAKRVMKSNNGRVFLEITAGGSHLSRFNALTPTVHSDVIETCLFVLWRHLEYYLMYCSPTDPKDALLPGASAFRSRSADGKEKRDL